MKKRIFALCSALLLSLTVFAGCGSKPTEESAASEPEATATAAPTAKAESSAAESTAEPTEALSTEPANVNLLTGLPTLTDGAIGKRPVAVMVNNVDAALPQYGISAADLIFELPGGIRPDPFDGGVRRLHAGAGRVFGAQLPILLSNFGGRV